ncbi:MAG: cupin domain-containing protein [Maricaulaceae bacterium]
MPLIDPKDAPLKIGASYPPEYNAPCANRSVLSLGDAGGLTQFGAHLVTLPVGSWASQRHVHSSEDEFCYILTGQPTLIDDNGEQLLYAGDALAHKAGDGNAHHLVNKSDQEVTFLVVGSRRPDIDDVTYPDIDLEVTSNGTMARHFTCKDGLPIK